MSSNGKEQSNGNFFLSTVILFVGAILGFIGGNIMPHKPTVMTQIVPSVCSSTITVHDPPTKEDCILFREENGGHREPLVTYTPDSLPPAAVGKWKSMDGSISIVFDEPRTMKSKKPPYHLRLTLPKDPPDYGFGCDFMIDGTVMSGSGPQAGKLQYRAWCRDHKDSRIFMHLDEDELAFSLEVEDKVKVPTTKLVRTQLCPPWALWTGRRSPSFEKS